MFNAAAIILAGGLNTRMNGTDKSRLVIGTRPLIECKLELFQDFFKEVIIVCNSSQVHDYPNVKTAIDEQQGHGPLMGLYSGLKASSYQTNFVTACDMPFINIELLKMLLEAAPAGDVVVPVVKGYWEPMLAVYNKRVLAAVHRSLQRHQRKMVSFFDQVKIYEFSEDRIKGIDPQLLSFINVNTPTDVKQAKEIVAANITNRKIK